VGSEEMAAGGRATGEHHDGGGRVDHEADSEATPPGLV
jgi:hypothetical protein